MSDFRVFYYLGIEHGVSQGWEVLKKLPGSVALRCDRISSRKEPRGPDSCWKSCFFGKLGIKNIEKPWIFIDFLAAHRAIVVKTLCVLVQSLLLGSF